MLVCDKEETNLKLLPSEVEGVSKARTIGGSLHIIIPKKLVNKLHISDGDEIRYVIHHLIIQGKDINVSDIKYIN